MAKMMGSDQNDLSLVTFFRAASPNDRDTCMRPLSLPSDDTNPPERSMRALEAKEVVMQVGRNEGAMVVG